MWARNHFFRYAKNRSVEEFRSQLAARLGLGEPDQTHLGGRDMVPYAAADVLPLRALFEFSESIPAREERFSFSDTSLSEDPLPLTLELIAKSKPHVWSENFQNVGTKSFFQTYENNQILGGVVPQRTTCCRYSLSPPKS